MAELSRRQLDPTSSDNACRLLFGMAVLSWSVGGISSSPRRYEYVDRSRDRRSLYLLGSGYDCAGVLYYNGSRGMPGMEETAPVYFEAASVIIALILLGRLLESRAKGRTSDAIRKLIGLQAKTARVIRDGNESDVPVEEVAPGDIVVVRPGEKVAVDGEIVAG